MNIPWGSDLAKIFVTNVGFITSTGSNGHNIMSVEWTHHVSYEPGLLAVCIHPRDATHENIAATKEFGVSIAASDQNVVASVSGNSSGHQVEKIKLLQELGVKFYPAQTIIPLMVEGAAANFECKVIQQITCGDHTMFLGDVLDAALHPEKTALVYHQGKYWRLSESLQKPPPQELERIKKLLEKYRKP